jgi:hypothetical protein
MINKPQRTLGNFWSVENTGGDINKEYSRESFRIEYEFLIC